MFCAECGESIASAANFCGKCGRAVEDMPSSLPVAAVDAEVATRAEKQKFSLARWYFGLTPGQRVFLWIASVLSIPIAGVGFLLLAVLIFLHLGRNPELPSDGIQ